MSKSFFQTCPMVYVPTASFIGVILVSLLTKSKSSKKAKAFDLSQAARKNILDLQPYRCARDDYSEGILLDANENSIGPALAAKETEKLELNRYPDPFHLDIKEKVILPIARIRFYYSTLKLIIIFHY